MAMLKTILLGRPDGLRRRLFRAIAGRVSPGGTAGAPTQPGPAPRPVEPAERSLGLRREPPRDVTPPDGYEVVLHKDALDPGAIVEIIIGGTAIAVANVDGAFHAISNACPHADGPLGEGSMDGPVVTCPYHGWQFDVRDGSCKTNPYAKVQTFPVKIVGDAVCVRL